MSVELSGLFVCLFVCLLIEGGEWRKKDRERGSGGGWGIRFREKERKDSVLAITHRL